MTAVAAQETQILRQFRDKIPYRPECNNCGEKFFRKKFEENLKESGILEDIEEASELFYMECPGCGSPQDFSERR